MTSLTPPTAVLYTSVSLTGFVAAAIPLPVALTPARTPFTTGVSQVHAAPWPSAFPVVLIADEVVEAAVPDAAEYAARAFFTDSLSVNWCAEDAKALVDSFHSLEALNSLRKVSVNTCQGVLSPCGGGGGGSSFFFCSFCSPSLDCSLPWSEDC